MIVMMAFSGPRLWSASVTGGKREGASGPGVGAAEKELQGAEAGLALLVTVGLTSSVCVDCVDGAAQEANKGMKRIAMKCFLYWRMGLLIIDGSLPEAGRRWSSMRWC